MRKITALLLALSFVLSLAMVAGASDEVKVKGTVMKIDEAAKSVTIKPKEGEAVTVVFADADKLSRVKEGEKGEAKYTVEDGKNVGIRVRKITSGCE